MTLWFFVFHVVSCVKWGKMPENRAKVGNRRFLRVVILSPFMPYIVSRKIATVLYMTYPTPPKNDFAMYRLYPFPTVGAVLEAF